MKTLFKVLALVLVVVLTFSMVSCGKQHYSAEYVLEEFDDIIRKIENHKHIHTEDLIPGMTEKEFAPIEEAIHVAIHDGGYIIMHNGTEDYVDDDNNHIYLVKYSVKSGENVVNVVVTYCDGHKTIYRIDLDK